MIVDPRQYTVIYPETNSVISQALLILDSQADNSTLPPLIAAHLQQENDALINVALNLAPNADCCNLIWSALQQTINMNATYIFAIPIILVAGSKTQVTLAHELNAEKLNQFFLRNDIFKSTHTSCISSQLLDPTTIAKLKPSQLYCMSRNSTNASLGLPWDVAGTETQVLNEGVFLRFLVGTTTETLNLDAFAKHKMELMQFILSELTVPGVTLFPIPFAPIPLSRAFADGETYRTEIAIQVALSNITREIRSLGKTPIAIISTATEAIKIIVRSSDPSVNLQEESLWHLHHFDDFNHIMTIIHNLLRDMQIEYSYAA